MSANEDICVAEKERQAKAGMCACRCSNCEPEASKQLSLRMKRLTNGNFDAGLQNPLSFPNPSSARSISEGDCEDLLEETNNEDYANVPMINQKPNNRPARKIELIPLAKQLGCAMQDLHQTLMGKADRLRSTDYVDEDDIWRILDRIYTINTEDDVYQILGCDILPGGVAKLFDSIREWKRGTVGSQAISQMRTREAAARVEQGRTLARLQKQHAERIKREAKVKETCILTDQKRKEKEIENREQKEAKRLRQEPSHQKKKVAAERKAKEEAQRIVNARMIASISSGKSM